MQKSFRSRIRNVNKHLRAYLQEQENFYVGLLFEDYLKSPLLKKYGLPTSFPSIDSSITPLPKGSVTRANVKGKYVRKEPEEKETIIKLIDYIHPTNGSHIRYNRKYHVYIKELAHKYNESIFFVENEHGQQIVVSDMLLYDLSKEYTVRNTHIVNMFYEMFGDYEIFDQSFNPAIHFNKKFDEIILPKGTLGSQNNLEEIVKIGSRFTRNEEAQKAFYKRIKVLQKYSPDIRGKGANGFLGYMAFGFSDYGIVLLETMYSGNATYVFRQDNYEEHIVKDKQTVLKNKLHLKRFAHDKKWEEKLEKFMRQQQRLLDNQE